MSDTTALVLLIIALLGFVLALLWLVVMFVTSPVGMAILAVAAFAAIALFVISTWKKP